MISNISLFFFTGDFFRIMQEFLLPEFSVVYKYPSKEK